MDFFKEKLYYKMMKNYKINKLIKNFKMLGFFNNKIIILILQKKRFKYLINKK